MVQPRGSGLIHGLFAVDILLEIDIRRLKDGYDVMDKLYNASTWFKHESSQRMLRTLDGSARAYLSNRYRYIDNIDIAGVTLSILNRLPDIRFESCQITESHMYIKAVPPPLADRGIPQRHCAGQGHHQQETRIMVRLPGKKSALA